MECMRHSRLNSVPTMSRTTPFPSPELLTWNRWPEIKLPTRPVAPYSSSTLISACTTTHSSVHNHTHRTARLYVLYGFLQKLVSPKLVGGKNLTLQWVNNENSLCNSSVCKISTHNLFISSTGRVAVELNCFNFFKNNELWYMKLDIFITISQNLH